MSSQISLSSLIPEFLQPLTEPPKKPDPTAGLPEYLQNKLGDSFETLESVDAKFLSFRLKSLAQAKFNTIVWLDLEINPETNKLIEGAVLFERYYWHFNASEFAKHAQALFDVLQQADYLSGHHLIEFDLPRVAEFFRQADIALTHDILSQWQSKTWDTLILSSLLIPHQTSHALAKLYKEHSHRNNPIKDCVESRMIFELCHTAWQQLIPEIQVLFGQLLPPLRQLTEQSKNQFFAIDSDCIVDWDSVMAQLPEGNHSALLDLLKHAFHHSQGYNNLGLACFVSWLRYFNKPQARRPVWISKHPVYKQSFQHAEDTFWHIHNPDENWINQQCKGFFYESQKIETLREGQMAIVKATLANQDIPLGILPTGGGKSLAFQLPALIFSKYQRQLTVVISPLKALIEDQVINLHAQLPQYESRIAYLTSGQTPETQKTIITGVWQGDIDILYLSPERLRTHSIRQLLKNRPPAFWVLDEAHALSQWGTDFRPDFLRIASHIVACYDSDDTKKIQDNLEILAKKPIEIDLFSEPKESNASTLSNFIPPKISLVTATASNRVKEDLDGELVNQLMAVTNNKPLVQYGTPIDSLKIWRDNIEPFFLNVSDASRMTEIYKILVERKADYEKNNPNNPEQGIALVYLRNRDACEEYAKHFAEQNLKAVAYHGKLDETQKKLILHKFKHDELDVVVCTNAFGMGIDKAGIHTVIHSGVPNNLESYVQEIGRGARKSHETAQAYMLWDTSDIERQFKSEQNSRIPNSDTLKNCWQQITPIFKKKPDDQWFPSSLLSPILTFEDVEQLNTQIRVALLALERHGLLIEREQMPAWVNIKLMARPNPENNPKLLKLYESLQQVNDDLPSHTFASNLTPQNDEQLTRYHLPELATVLGYSVKELLNLLRQLVNLGYAQWKVVIHIRLKEPDKKSKRNVKDFVKKTFSQKVKWLTAMQACVESETIQLGEMAMNSQDNEFMRVNSRAIDQWLIAHQYHFNSQEHIFPLLQNLGVLAFRHWHGQYWTVSSTQHTKAELQKNHLDDTWKNWLSIAQAQLNKLNDLLEKTIFPQLDDSKKEISKNFTLDELCLIPATEHEVEQKAEPNEILQQLEQLQKLELIELARLDDDSNALFFVSDNRQFNKQKNQKYSKTAYDYLQTHYNDRCQRIHVLNFWLNADMSVKKTMLEDYFRLPLDNVIKRYLPKTTDVTKPYLKDYSTVIIPEHFSEVQKSIIKDTSRASMILAGAGAGKTTVVVHRVAYLLMIEEIKPEKILILAYNRLAVCELRERLKNLVGTNANGVTILTFHALARQITSLSEKDAPLGQLNEICVRVFNIQSDKISDKDRNNARYQWLIEQAISHLQESPQHFQYIMVDEFQDIDAYQYELIGLLADLQLAEDDETEIIEPVENSTKSSETTNAENYEQRGYLMVVGDDDQNLYAFRGASIKFIQQFEQNYHLDTQQKFYLLNNYRSADNIVTLANAFISQALPQEQRLKDALHQIIATQPYADTPIRYGVYSQPHGIDMANWLAHDIQTKLSEFESLEKKPTIAVLAPKWQYFDAVQHYLEKLGINSQRYNESEQLIPLNSVIGQALYHFLDNNRLEMIVENVAEFLENWRQSNAFNPLDKAWTAIVSNLQALPTSENVTYEQLLQRLEITQYESDKPVTLITYHSAKGIEFDHVYVIDQISQYQQANPTANQTSNSQDTIRPMYVALTRAKQSLTLLQHHKEYQPILATLLRKLLANQAEKVDIPNVPKPDYLSFHRFLQLEEIVLTPKALVSEQGREFVNDKFTKDGWGKNADVFEKFSQKSYQKDKRADGFYTPQGQLITQFSSTLTKALGQNNHTQIQLQGFTTTRFFQQDMTWYEKANYTGTETSHYLIVPFVGFEIKTSKQ